MPLEPVEARSSTPLRERSVEEILSTLGPHGLPHPHYPLGRSPSPQERELAATMGNPLSLHGWTHQDFNERREGDSSDDEPPVKRLHDLELSQIDNLHSVEGRIHDVVHGDTGNQNRMNFHVRNHLDVPLATSGVAPEEEGDYFSRRPAPDSPRKSKQMGDDFNNPRLFRHRFTKFARRRPTFYARSTRRQSQGQIQNDMETTLRAQSLISTLMMGGPSVNFLALLLLEDEYGISRSPLLLLLMGLTVTDITGDPKKKNRKFRISLEYGVGPERMKWHVDHSASDLIRFHSILKLKQKWTKGRSQIEQRMRLPTVPYPPLWKRNKDEKDFSGDDCANDNALLISAATGRLLRSTIHQLSLVLSRGSNAHQSQNVEAYRNRKNSEYILKVWEYLREVTRVVAFRPESNKLFHFLEISPISCLLGYENGYSGKQGVIHIGGTAKSQGWRVGHFKPNELIDIIDRRKDKWMLVRGSYIMYVSNINSTIPLEVFLVDSYFKIEYENDVDLKDEDELDIEDAKNQLTLINPFSHKITLENGERKLVLHVKEREQQKWLKSLYEMKHSLVYLGTNRFGLFAPIRNNVFAKWFVDGRDHFWAVLAALEMAKDTIYIHDWWLSPELYLRRPANGNQQWRLDRVLQRKAQQGIKIFVVVYRNVGTTVATDSLYTKHSLLSMNEDNIHVMRSPNQILSGTYFWAHHEKLCIIDLTVAFVGGIDLCYGRYDTAEHVLVDDSKINFELLDPNAGNVDDFTKFQIFPGKDYSNPRVKDFFDLDKPYDDMYDRNKTPRMPWHDVHMMTAGQTARDLARHFVQRWNYLLRQKRPLRLTPLLTPPPDLTEEQVRQYGLNGSCEVQICRSLGEWSLGLKQHEQLIQNAYLKLIETLDHFVYIENQFFITSCEVEGTIIQNRIGDALVERAIRAYKEGTQWRAVIVIPLMPGFPAEIDDAEGSSVRVIMDCQYYSILRGSTLIFAKLRKAGIDPDQYIQFFSLRKWGRIGPLRNLTTEQLYIHAKTMIVDDRAAIIGLANINERLMRGLRDSEVAAVVRDSETIDSTMFGKPYRVGKFPHTLRLRLMREHLGISIDILDTVERRFAKFEEFAATPAGMMACTGIYPNQKHVQMSAAVELALRDILMQPGGTERWKNFQRLHNFKDDAKFPEDMDDEVFGYDDRILPVPLTVSFNNRTGSHEANKGIRDKKKHSYDSRVQHSLEKSKDVLGEGLDKYKLKLAKRARIYASKTLRELAHTQMMENPTKQFLPDLDTVEEFLNSNDAEMVDEMDEELSEVIYHRNLERWMLLKRILYLQRVAAKAKHDEDKESKKRVAAGLTPTVQISNSSRSTPEPEELGYATDADPNKRDAVNIEPTDGNKTHANSVPIVALNETQVRDVVDTINDYSIDNFSRWVDPYGFEDPVCDEFYEDLWNDMARRNTELFRLVFHCQPDDLVLTWSEYKTYSRMFKAFLLSQDKEAQYRVRRNVIGETLPLLDSESESLDDDEPRYHPGIAKRNSLIAFKNEATEMKAQVEPIKEEDENTDERTDLNLTAVPHLTPVRKRKRRPRRRMRYGNCIYERETAERFLQEIQGHLVYFPADWLQKEIDGDNWFQSMDRVPPLEIYD